MAESLFDEIKRYVDFAPSDEAALIALHKVAQPHFSAIADEFYERLRAFPAAAQVFRNDEQVDRLKVTMRGWMDRLLGGPWDQTYFELRSRIGRVHVQVRLPQRYMFTAMNVIRVHLLAIAHRDLAGDAAQLQRVAAALHKIIDLDLVIMLESYRDDSMDAVRRYERMEKELLERRLAISETRYHEIVENAEVMIIAIDHAGRIVLFNRKAEEVSGYKRGEVLGEPCLELLCTAESRPQAEAALMAASPERRGGAFDAVLRTQSGALRWTSWQVTRLAAPGGAVACVIGRDVTDERALAQRTRRAERLAGLGTLAAGLAHEIRNPLNSAQLQLTLVERRLAKATSTDREKALVAARVVREELARLGGLVEEFLDFARPRSLRLAAGDLCETVKTVITLLEPEMEEAGLTVVTRLEGPVAARYDDERIKQVLLNLVRNAVEAAGRGGHVGLSVSRNVHTGVIEVEDSGPGPAPDVNIFAPFTTTKESGTGLGLPIVHRIVSAHGGEVSWHRANDSTVFRIELPLDGPVEPTSS